ncbi:unnamed protein product [Candidula unifasciata]|uniref:Solute carrier family 46 member 3 n=1 Tax=Candidula unifasciata TaxID=100452 RepID=A0A8S3YGV0_9EUPU|nr:unnamed protein product [Candidula unifasciata]
MRRDSTSRLLPDDEASETLPANQTMTSSVSRIKDKCPFIIINLIVVLLGASGRFHTPVLVQYLYQRYADEIFGNASVKTSSHPCINESSASSKEESKLKEVQEMTSDMLFFLNLTNYCPGIFTCLILGAFSNRISRKLQLAIPMCGYLTKCVVIAVVVGFNLHVNWFFLGFAVQGALGDTCGVFLGIFLYTTDITPRDKTRTLAMSIVEGFRGFVAAGLNVVTGHLIQRLGFNIPALLSVGLALISLVITFMLPAREAQHQYTLVDDDCHRWNNWWRRLISPFTRIREARVRKLVLVGFIAFLFAMAASVGITVIESVYLMNIPFCFDAITLGWYKFGRELAFNGFLVVAVPLFYNSLPGMWLAILGSLSAICGMVMYSTATKPAEVYAIIGLMIGEALPVNIIRGETSRLLASETQGPLLAVFAMLENIGYVMGIPALHVYRATLGFFKQLVCVVCASVTAVNIGFLLYYQVTWKRHLLDVQSNKIRQRSYDAIN